MGESRIETRVESFNNNYPENKTKWTLGLDINAYYRTVATTADPLRDDIKVKGDEGVVDGDANAVQMYGDDWNELGVSNSIELHVGLPVGITSSMSSNDIYVRHTKDSMDKVAAGTASWHYHKGTLSGVREFRTFTFTSTDGLSYFEVSNEANIVVENKTQGTAYETLQDAVNDARSGDTTFNPGGTVTRAQVVTILCRYADYKKYDVTGRADLSGFADAAKVAGWASDGMRWAVAKELILGTDGGVLDPKGSATRAQAAAIMMRFCEKVAG